MSHSYFLELQHTDILAKISKVEAALSLLVLAELPSAKALCDKLTAKLQGDTWQWIADEELEVSALAVLAVYTYRPAEVDGTCLAYLTNKMLASEVEVGGPYYDNQRKVDITTNLVISRLFTLFDSPLENVELFLKKRHSPTALSGTSGVIYYFLRDWPRTSFSKAKIQNISQHLPFFAKALNYKTTLSSSLSTPAPHEVISKHVYSELQSLDTSLRPHAVSAWNMINNADIHHEISMLPLYFARSLTNQLRIPKDLPINLGVANFFVWIAYTIYDDFIDQEGQVELLPVANCALRKALALYEEMSRKAPLIWKEILATFDTMDAANSWELAHCRYEVENGHIHVGRLPAYAGYSVLASRAWGHVLGPIILINKLQTTPAQVLDIKKAFKHFLIAKQLSDDLLDWKDDIEKGHVSPVVAHILKATNTAPSAYNLVELTRKMQEYMWAQGVQEITDIILKQLAVSRRHFKKSSLVRFDGEFFLHVFDPLEASAHENELNDTRQKQFLAAYSSEYNKNR